MSINPPAPELSLISSWCVHPSAHKSNADAVPRLIGLELALEDGIRLHDLYFLGHEDIPVYARWINMPKDETPVEPHAFAAKLTKEDIEQRIAVRLRALLASAYNGALVGRRPRIAALATFFARISSLDDEKREDAVNAIKNALRLASELGCHCVEIVGGTSVPMLGSTSSRESARNKTPEEYRAERMNALVDSLCDLADFWQRELNADGGHAPLLALELEPGPGFLLNSIDAYREVKTALQTRQRQGVSGAAAALECVGLNLDVAHAFLLGLDAEEIEKEFLHDIVHMHLSDHAGHAGRGGVHAADLPPRTFHVYKGEFEPWIALAKNLTAKSARFSKVIAIELEACMDRAVVATALNTTRKWLNAPGDPAPTQDGAAPISHNRRVLGALLVVDLGNSTKELVSHQDDAAMQLEEHLGGLCRDILARSGSVMSFTGDGFIALFEERDFRSAQLAAETALEAACVAARTSREAAGNKSGLTYRAALHWGEAFVPNTGALREQILGENVVCAARLCAWVGRVEAGTPRHERGAFYAMTQEFKEALEPNDTMSKADPDAPPRPRFRQWGEEEFKGLDGRAYGVWFAVDPGNQG
jgi:class 3 adenylate cyclase